MKFIYLTYDLFDEFEIISRQRMSKMKKEFQDFIEKQQEIIDEAVNFDQWTLEI